MRWKMCSKCGIKLTIEVSEPDLCIYKCNACKQSFIEIKGKLLKYMQEKAKEVNKDAEQLLMEALDRLEKYETKNGNKGEKDRFG